MGEGQVQARGQRARHLATILNVGIGANIAVDMYTGLRIDAQEGTGVQCRLDVVGYGA